MSTDLRQKLIDAQLATYPESADEHSPVAGPHWRTNEQAADAALVVFAEWLREQAAALRAEPFQHEPGLVGRASQIMVEQTAKYLENVLADSITTPKGEQT